MTEVATREAYYDAEIAPELAALAAKCKLRGLSLVAVVEWAPGESGRTATLTGGQGIGMQMVWLAAQADGNADALIGALIKQGKEHGHNSVYLHILEPKTQ